MDKLGFAEKFVLSVGLSVAFLMFVGLLINEVYYAVGYKTPLSTYSLMISFSLIMFGLLYLTYKRNFDIVILNDSPIDYVNDLIRNMFKG